MRRERARISGISGPGSSISTTRFIPPTAISSPSRRADDGVRAGSSRPRFPGGPRSPEGLLPRPWDDVERVDAASTAIDPEDFSPSVHDIDLSVLQPDPSLASALARLPGRRFVFTNGCRNHADTRAGAAEAASPVRRNLGHPHDRLSPEARSARLSRRSARNRTWRADESAMFEDVARNLVPAHALGLTTVWLKNGSAWSKQGPEFPVAGTRANPLRDRRPSAISPQHQDLT